MKPGDTVWMRVDKADGSAHRWWQARVEVVDDEGIVTYSPAGSPVYHNRERFPKQVYSQPWHIRSYYWFGRGHNLLEVYTPDGRLYELYCDIISPIEVSDGEIRFIDHELDVQQLAGEAPRVIDQDEFEEAATAYGYSEAFMRRCHALAAELVDVMTAWEPLGPGFRD